MFRPGRPLLRQGTMQQLKQLARDGFSTVKAMSDPRQMVTVMRYEESLREFVAQVPVEAVVRYDQSRATDHAVGGSTDTVAVVGSIRREAPWDIRRGDRVELANGAVLIITAPDPYEHFGVMRARWRQEQGNP